MTGDVTVTNAMAVDGVIVQETEMTITKQGAVGSFAANSSLLDESDLNRIQPDSYIDFYVKASTGTPTITVQYLNILIKED